MPSSDATVPLWINGERKAASDGRTFIVRNPQTNEVVSISASATKKDCEAAILAANASLESWERTSAATKAAIFRRAALLASEKYRDKIIEANISETATSPLWAAIDAMSTVGYFQHAADLPERIKGETWPSETPGAIAMIQRRPMGVVLAIAPWNAPASISARAICVPLVCGNPVLLKTSERCPRTQTLVADILNEAGLPPGVLNVVSMSEENSPRLTADIIAHPMVRKLNFTGGEAVAKVIAGEAARHLKPCVLELGGNCAAVVLNDADVDAASRAIVFGGMIHSGQICMATQRVIAQRSIAPSLTASLTRLISSLKAGDPIQDPSVQLGCLNESSAQNIVSQLEEAKAQGAEFLVGDGTRVGPTVQPHLIRGIKPGMHVWERENFGPVIAMAEVDTVDEAVGLANSTDYSLSASVWTKDVHLSVDVARRVRAGYVIVNGATIHAEREFGLGGLGGASGYGRFDIEDWTTKRMIVLHPPNQQYPLVG